MAGPTICVCVDAWVAASLASLYCCLCLGRRRLAAIRRGRFLRFLRIVDAHCGKLCCAENRLRLQARSAGCATVARRWLAIAAIKAWHQPEADRPRSLAAAEGVRRYKFGIGAPSRWNICAVKGYYRQERLPRHFRIVEITGRYARQYEAGELFRRQNSFPDFNRWISGETAATLSGAISGYLVSIDTSVIDFIMF